MTSLPGLPELLDLDFGHFNADLAFYEELARRGDGTALDLGSGTGRVAIPLARAGIEVHCIEQDEAMIARMASKAGAESPARVHVSCGDIRRFDLGREFGLVFAAYGTLHHLLSQEDQMACLRNVRRHLAPGGTFACDLTPMLTAIWDPAETAPLLHDWTRTLPGGETVTKLRTVLPDRAEQVQHETHIYDCVSSDGTVRRVTKQVDLRFTSRYEMEALLRLAGLELEDVYGDYDLTPYNDASDYMIIVATRGKEPA
jgi:SAM-dependent methyltransferase